MALDWQTIENALQTWIVAATGLPTSAVIFASQNAPAPAMPYATIKISGPRGTMAQPALQIETNLLNPAGEEIEQTVTLHQEVTVSCQVYAAATAGTGTAKEYLEKARTALFLPTRLDALSTAGLAVVEMGDTQDLTALLGTAWESRAAMDVRMNLVDTAVEKTGYIATVETTDETTH